MIGLLLAFALAGQDPHLPADCAEAMTTLEVNACAGAELQAETARMEQYLEAARTRAAQTDRAHGDTPTDQVQRLDAAQAAWETYAAHVCEGVYDRWQAGTIRTAMAIGCRIDLTRERTRVIWRTRLTYPDSTPPILPEPVEPASAAR